MSSPSRWRVFKAKIRGEDVQTLYTRYYLRSCVPDPLTLHQFLISNQTQNIMNETIQTSQAVQTVTSMVEQIKGLPYFTKIKFITIIHKLASDEQLDEIPDVTEALDHLNELREFLFNLKYAQNVSASRK